MTTPIPRILVSCALAMVPVGCSRMDSSTVAVRPAEEPKPVATSPVVPASVEVQRHGVMHEVLGGGAESAVALVSLGEILAKPNAHAVGALPRLAGEITIAGGQAWIARAADGGVRVEGPLTASDQSAALLFAAHVEAWDDVAVDRDLAGTEVDAFVGETAAQQGFDASRPLPFVFEGPVSDLTLHVVNGACPTSGAPLDATQAPWLHETTSPQVATIVGFHAVGAEGQMTHPGTAIHAHALLDASGQRVTGHLERVTVLAGSVLRLPRAR